MTDPNDENLTRTWTPDPDARAVPAGGDPFGHYASEQPEPFVVTTSDPDDADR